MAFSESAYSDAPLIPTFTPSGAFTGPITVVLGGEEDTVIRYSLDGSDPRLESGIEYAAPIPLVASATVKAVALRDGQMSPVVSQNFVRQSPVNVRPLQFDPYANP